MAPATKSAAQYDADYLSYNDFYETLAPFGQWLQDPQYGYVWLPAEDVNFRPYYTNGYWAMTEYGNTWISEYPWGWACFHYGRWTYDGYYGWLWVPGSQWAPAWVSWRQADGFYGWAPLAPGYEVTATPARYRCPSDWWVFIPPRYIHSGNYYRFWYGPRDNKKLVKGSLPITNSFTRGGTTYLTGPAAAQVKQLTGTPVQVYRVRNSKNHNTRVHGDEVRMYRPEEIPKAPRIGEVGPPPNVMNAPHPVNPGQPVNANSGSVRPFREAMISRDNASQVVPGTNIRPTAEPHSQHVEKNPYEWDVSRSVKQEYTPAPKQAKPQPPAKPVAKPTVRRRPQQPKPAQPQPQPGQRPAQGR